MKSQKVTLIPSVDSVVNASAKFTKGKRYPAVMFTSYSGNLLYKVSDDNGCEYAVDPKESQYLGGHRFDIEYEIECEIEAPCIGNGLINRACIVDLIKSENHAENEKTDRLLSEVVRHGISWALSDASCESFMREPFSRIAELEKQVAFMTGELQAAIATIEKVREIMRTEPGYDVEDHARVLRMMADAFAKLQQ